MPSKSRIRIVALMLALGISLQGRAWAGGLSVVWTSVPPIIDGVLEDGWRTADSISSFTQLQPNEGRPSSEPSIAYVLQAADGIYFAFRCGTPGRSPDRRPGPRGGKDGDYVSVYLDTYRDRRNAFRFTVSCASVQADEVVSADGREHNPDWDAVFQSAAVCDSTGYSVEMRIPWSSLRYPRGGDTWGFNIERAIPVNGELSYAVPVRINEGLCVSGFADLTELRPAARANRVELYPQAFVRTEKGTRGISRTLRPAADINWNISSSWRLQSTFNPDYSQIEADPYALNLSRYDRYFTEKRSFFVEGKEFFRSTGGAMAGMLEMFYSRNVGRKLPDGTEVPVHAGLRTTVKFGRDELAAFAAATGSANYQSFIGPAFEPRATFGVARWGHQFAPQITGAILAAGKLTDSLDNTVLSMDGTVSTRTFQLTGQIGRSEFGIQSDWAAKSFFIFHPRAFSLKGYAAIIGDRFNVSQIGYVPWAGLHRFTLSAGPTFIRDTGVIAYAGAYFAAEASREFGESHYSHSYAVQVEASFRNNWGATATLQLGREYEPTGDYNPRAWGFSLSSDMSRRAWFSVSCYSSFGFNYLREFFARSEYGDWYSAWRVSQPLSLEFDGSLWVERDPRGRAEEITWRSRVGASCAIREGMNAGLYTEIPVTQTEGVLSFRIGLTCSYNFAPRSWIYLAFNDWQTREDNRYHPQHRVFAAKIKYLISI
ncbi:MAG: carbohydrate binding family 9 domain-containing protein [candidate division Zixibacteria bacterium]|nr:carbohydrate binding family 9 domain-containing protein [candidate division Zixibacteria bacterium]